MSMLQRKLLQPNHFPDTSRLKETLLSFIAASNQRAKPIKWSYTVEQLERTLGVNLR
ncbi:MAG TPA: hypothetical protein VKT82_08725 [Ktedonobacterales bacterium]|nr:hypothetical protein [Ktedonobacterales bacterium]